jgi:hypothetical protein
VGAGWCFDGDRLEGEGSLKTLCRSCFKLEATTVFARRKDENSDVPPELSKSQELLNSSSTVAISINDGEID